MKLSVVIPVYNEEATIEEILRRVEALELDLEIIVVDDGSSDGTRSILERLKHKDALQVHFSPRNQGKGAATRKGIELARGEVVIIQDADLELHPGEYPKLIEPIAAGRAEVVYGSRFSGGRNRQRNLAFMANTLLTHLTNVLYGSNITDMETCYKVFRSNVIKSLKLDCKGFEFEPEVTGKLLRLGYKIVEVPVSYNPRSEEEGKKIRWTDGFEAVWTLIRYRFSSKRGFLAST